MSDLTITLIQCPLAWHAPEKNRSAFEQTFAILESHPDIVVLPEMFTTGFTMQPDQCAENMQGETLQWMANHASRLNSVITGSLVIEEKGHYFNRLIWMRPDGTHDYYDKRHLFRMAGEHNAYTAGNRLLTVELGDWKIRPFVCYDLRFPVWVRSKQDIDLALFVANWPSPRIHVWTTLLQARAIENLCYSVGVNRIGEDNNGKLYTGQSALFDFLGNPVVEAKDQAGHFTATISREKLLAFREKFPVHLDADDFNIIV